MKKCNLASSCFDSLKDAKCNVFLVVRVLVVREQNQTVHEQSSFEIFLKVLVSEISQATNCRKEAGKKVFFSLSEVYIFDVRNHIDVLNGKTCFDC